MASGARLKLMSAGQLRKSASHRQWRKSHRGFLRKIQLPLLPGLKRKLTGNPGLSRKPLNRSALRNLRCRMPFPERGKQSILRRQSNSGVDRKSVLDMIGAMRKEQLSYEKIARTLEAQGIPTFSGKGAWHSQTVSKLCHHFHPSLVQGA